MPVEIPMFRSGQGEITGPGEVSPGETFTIKITYTNTVKAGGSCTVVLVDENGNELFSDVVSRGEMIEETSSLTGFLIGSAIGSKIGKNLSS